MGELYHAKKKKKSNYTRHLNVWIVGNYREMCKWCNNIYKYMYINSNNNNVKVIQTQMRHIRHKNYSSNSTRHVLLMYACVFSVFSFLSFFVPCVGLIWWRSNNGSQLTNKWIITAWTKGRPKRIRHNRFKWSMAFFDVFMERYARISYLIMKSMENPNWICFRCECVWHWTVVDQYEFIFVYCCYSFFTTSTCIRHVCCLFIHWSSNWIQWCVFYNIISFSANWTKRMAFSTTNFLAHNSLMRGKNA